MVRKINVKLGLSIVPEILSLEISVAVTMISVEIGGRANKVSGGHHR